MPLYLKPASTTGVYNVLDNGLSPANTGAANLAAINTLMTAAIDNATLYFPPNATPYDFSGTINIPSGKHFTFLGDGQEKSLIRTTSATADIFVCNDWYQTFDGLRFSSSVARTAGRAIYSGNNVAVSVFNCDFTGMWDGIVYSGGIQAGNLAIISNVNFTAGLNRDIVLDGQNANTIIDTLVCDGTAGVRQAAIEVNQCGSLVVSNTDLIRAVNNLKINPTTPLGVFSLYCVNTFFDTASGSSVKFMGTGNVQRVKFTNSWFSGSVTGCEFVSTAATLPTAIDFVACDIFGNSAFGILAQGVQDFSATMCRVAGNGTAGVRVIPSASSVTKVSVTNSTVGPTAGFGANGIGIDLTTGTYGGVRVRGNDVRGNTSNLNIQDLSAVATLDLKVIGDNLGHLLSGALDTLAASVTTSGTTETVLKTVRIPANAVTVGQAFSFALHGVSTTATAGTGGLTFRVRVGTTGTATDAVAWVSTAGSTTQAQNARAGIINGQLTVRSIGAAGTVGVEALAYQSTALLPTAVAAVALTTAVTTNPWFITITCTAAAGGFNAQQLYIEAL